MTGVDLFLATARMLVGFNNVPSKWVEILGLGYVEQGMETQGSDGLQWICSMDLFCSWVIYFVPRALDTVSNCIDLWSTVVV